MWITLKGKPLPFGSFRAALECNDNPLDEPCSVTGSDTIGA